MNNLARYDRFIYGCLLLFVFTVPVIWLSEGLFVLGLIGWGLKTAAERKFRWQRTPLDFPILCFVAIAFLSSFWGVGVRTTFCGVEINNSLLGFRTYGLILIVYLVLSNVRQPGGSKALVWTLIGGTSILSVYIIVHRLLLKRASGLDSGWDPVILAGSMSEAGQLLIVIGITVALLLYQRRRGVKMLLLAALLVMIVAEILNFKRGSWIALIFILIVQGWVKSRKIIPVVVIASIAILLLYQPARERLLSIRSEFSTVGGGRLAMWRTVPAILKDHPMGVGIDNVGEVMYDYNPEIEKNRDHLHNTYLQILAEMGPLGLIAFSWWMIAFIKISYRVFRRSQDKNPYEKAVSLGIFSVFIGFLINGIVEFNFGDSEVVMLIYFLMGLTLLSNRRPGSAH